jgi:fructokinase
MIYTLGESLMDVIHSYDGATVSKPGGSMLNVAVSLSRAGNEVVLVSELGDDATGRQLLEFLKDNHVKTNFVTVYKYCNTSKAIATLDKNSKPSYTFQKAYPNERGLPKPPTFSKNDILILGSMYSRDPEIEHDLEQYLAAAKRGGALIVYDPNVRHNHQLKKEAGKTMLLKNFKFAEIIKGSDEDFHNIFELSAPEKMKDALLKINNSALICITLGAEGSMAYYKGIEAEFAPKRIKPISTIGAGDAFTAGIINFISAHKLAGNLEDLTEKELKEMLKEGSRFSSLVCQSFENYIPEQN